MSWLRNDSIAGLILAMFALVLHLFVIPDQVQSISEGPVALSPSLFCHITTFLLLILSLSLAISGIREKKSLTASEPATTSSMKYIVARGTTAVILSGLYIVLIDFLGYFVSTTIFMMVFLYFSGVRSWKGALVFLVVIIPFIYVLFVKALKVLLPTGLMI